MIGQPSGILAALVHPDHRNQRGEGEGDEQGGEPITDELNFRHEEDHCGGEEELDEIEGGKGENFIPRNTVHKLAGAITIGLSWRYARRSISLWLDFDFQLDLPSRPRGGGG